MILDDERQSFLLAFTEEATDLLQSMEDALLALEGDPDDHESLNAVFRAMHTIKSMAGVFGYTPVVNFTHAVETLMDKLRTGRRILTASLIATLFECRDHTARLVDFILADVEGDAPLDEALGRAGAALLARIEKPREFASDTGGAMSLAPAMTQTRTEALASTDECSEQRILESGSAYTRYLELLAMPPDEQVGCIGDLLVSVGALTPHELTRALRIQKSADQGSTMSEGPPVKRRLGEILVEQGVATPDVVGQAARTQEAVRHRRQEETRQIRVDAQRLGHLIDLVGELVTSSAAIRVMVQRAGIEDMTEVVDGV
ncbi:chemotaxis protein CheA, partial [Thiocystis minor]|uniref:Hpt domain-containing protein n=1 Tax=Thiocystis minor TaxID=61597 RepID=UPI0019124472